MIIEDDGRRITDKGGISASACMYFDNLLTSSSPFVEDLNLCSEVITGLGCGDVLRGLTSCLKVEALKAVCMVLWGIWGMRNETVDKRKVRNVATLVDGVLGFLQEFQSSFEEKSLATDAAATANFQCQKIVTMTFTFVARGNCVVA
ncbi:hypothetical protein QYF36_027155 [Acer negundo]|nr:hypothetical protein QYF36_027155 [Acer negundo]